MKIIWLFTSIFFLIYSSKPTVNLKPFSISFETPYIPFAIFFLVISISLFQIQSQKGEYKKGLDEGIRFTVDYFYKTKKQN